MTSPHRSPALRRLRRAAALPLVLLLAGQMSPGPVAADTKAELDAARKRVERIEGELEGIQARKAELGGEIRQLTAQLSQVTTAIESLTAAIETTRDDIERRDRRVTRLQTQLDDRARSAYIQGPAGAIELVLAADSLADLADRVTFLEFLSRDDSSLAAGVAVEREALARQRGQLQEYREEYRGLQAELEGEQEVLQAKWDEEAALEAEVEDRLAEVEELVKDLRQKHQRELRAAARAAAAAAASPSGGGGSAPVLRGNGPFRACPVDAPRSYIDDFGYPRSGGRSHQGNDIFAPHGTPIRAPFAGTARESSNSLGGLSVHVYAGNGDFVYNAHLSRYAGVNGQVQAGELIGYVGNTGNAVGTPPHNHFEYHPGGGAAVSPYVYLNAVCGVGGAG